MTRLTVDGEPLTTGGQHDDPVRHFDEMFGDRGHLVEHVLAVVEDDAAPLVSQHLDEAVDVGLIGPTLHRGRCHHDVDDAATGCRRQIAEDDVVDVGAEAVRESPSPGGSCRRHPAR